MLRALMSKLIISSQEMIKLLKSVVVFEKDLKPVTMPGIMPGRYMVSTNGDVLDLKLNAFIPHYINNSGYETVSLRTEKPYISQHGNTCYGVRKAVSRITAYEHCPNPDLTKQVDHIDEDKHNNYYKNLEWVNQSENIQRNQDKGNRKPKECYIPPYHEGIPNFPVNQKPSEEQINKVAQLIQDSDPKTPYAKICEEAGLYNLPPNKAKQICSSLVNGYEFKDIAEKYDFSNRKANQRTNLSNEYKTDLWECYKQNNMDAKSTFDSFDKEDGKWKDQSKKNKDRFYKILARLKKEKS